MATGLWVVSSQVKMYLAGHNPNILPALILVSTLMSIGLITLGYSGTLHIASPNADDRFYSIKKLMWFELLGAVLGECVL